MQRSGTLALAFVVASRKLRPYFHARSIEVLTNYLLHQVLQKPEASGKLLKWTIELGQFDMNFFPRMAIKGQVLTEFTYVDATEVARTADNTETAKVVEAQGEKKSLFIRGDVAQ